MISKFFMILLISISSNFWGFWIIIKVPIGRKDARRSVQLTKCRRSKCPRTEFFRTKSPSAEVCNKGVSKNTIHFFMGKDKVSHVCNLQQRVFFFRQDFFLCYWPLHIWIILALYHISIDARHRAIDVRNISHLISCLSICTRYKVKLLDWNV